MKSKNCFPHPPQSLVPDVPLLGCWGCNPEYSTTFSKMKVQNSSLTLQHSQPTSPTHKYRYTNKKKSELLYFSVITEEYLATWVLLCDRKSTLLYNLTTTFWCYKAGITNTTCVYCVPCA